MEKVKIICKLTLLVISFASCSDRSQNLNENTHIVFRGHGSSVELLAETPIFNYPYNIYKLDSFNVQSFTSDKYVIELLNQILSHIKHYIYHEGNDEANFYLTDVNFSLKADKKSLLTNFNVLYTLSQFDDIKDKYKFNYNDIDKWIVMLSHYSSVDYSISIDKQNDINKQKALEKGLNEWQLIIPVTGNFSGKDFSCVYTVGNDSCICGLQQ